MDEGIHGVWDQIFDVASELAHHQILGITKKKKKRLHVCKSNTSFSTFFLVLDSSVVVTFSITKQPFRGLNLKSINKAKKTMQLQMPRWNLPKRMEFPLEDTTYPGKIHISRLDGLNPFLVANCKRRLPRESIQ